jgi:hypothetical protein
MMDGFVKSPPPRRGPDQSGKAFYLAISILNFFAIIEEGLI